MPGLLLLVPLLALLAEDIDVLQRDKPVERTLAPPAVHNYAVALKEGDFLRAVVEQRGIDVVVSVHGPDGKKITEIDSPNGANGPEPIELPASASGTYRIEIRPFEGSPAGKYEAKIIAVLSPAERAAEIAAERAARAATAERFAKNAIPLRTPEAGHGFEDMLPLQRLIGDARIVSLGEATHGTREFFQFKHRMLEFLVTKMGFSVFGIEATMPEAFAINEYVLTGRGDARKALGALYFWTWNTEEVLEMIEWMRRYNADPSHTRKVKFYGFDMQYAPQAVEVVLDYLQKVDPEEAAKARSGLARLANPFTGDLFDSQPEERKRAAVGAIAAVMKAFDDRKGDYVRKTSETRYAIARQHARIVQQNLESRTGDPYAASFVRDRAMAENVRWILDHEGRDAKIVLWAHNAHVATNVEGMMGAWLRKAFGRDMIVIGFAFNQGSFQAIESLGQRSGSLRVHHVSPAPDHTLDSVLAASRLPLVVVDLRTLPKEGIVSKWLNEPQQTLRFGAVYSEESAANYRRKMKVTDAYDALVFFDKTTAARANPGGRRKIEYLPAPANLGFEEDGPAGDPPGWQIPAVLATFDFSATVTTENPRSGKRCLTIRREKGRHYGAAYGYVQQVLEGEAYRGKRVRLRAFVRTRMRDAGGQAHLWLRTRSAGVAHQVYAEGSDRPIVTDEWQAVELVADVPDQTQVLGYGLALVGEGQVWIDDVTLEFIAR